MEKLIPRAATRICNYTLLTQGWQRPQTLSTIDLLRIRRMQQWNSRSDPAMEGALYKIASMRLFAGFSLGGAIPDHTIIINFRHLLERYGVGT